MSAQNVDQQIEQIRQKIDVAKSQLEETKRKIIESTSPQEKAQLSSQIFKQISDLTELTKDVFTLAKLQSQQPTQSNEVSPDK